MKRFASLFLALLLCLTLVPAALPRASAAGGVAVNKTNFPDDVFRSYVSAQFDTDGDHVLSAEEIDAATNINLDNASVASLKGVELLPGLTWLSCSYNLDLTALDVSANTNLTALYCSGCSLTSLKLGSQPTLTKINAFMNKLTVLDVSGCTELNELNVAYNLLTALDLTANTRMQLLWCPYNDIKTLDLSHNPEMKFVSVPYTKITLLDVSHCPALVEAYENGEREEQVLGDHTIVYYKAQEFMGGMYVDAGMLIAAGKPVVTAQPRDRYALPDATAKFTVKAYGEGLTYQWYYRTSETGTWKKTGLTGSTTATLSVKATEARNGYQYKCMVSNDKGRAYTVPATLTVSAVPVIITQPVSQKAGVGGTAKFTVTAGCAETYQWYYRTSSDGAWQKWPGTGNTAASLTVKATEARNGYQFKCRVSNANGSAYTKVVTLKVSAKPVIVVQPADQYPVGGITAKFTVKASGADLTYQWYYRTSETGTWRKSTLTGAATATLSVKAKVERDGYQYRCKISNANGSVYTAPATLNLYAG
ncbi:MAG: hypothetical protein II458_08355 [Oscillospiraceae bacterium]|nr:hypothetical protein [Oscillospiraceae bacterium]